MDASTYIDSDGTPVTICPYCRKHVRPEDEHDFAACHDDMCEAADNERKRRREEPELYGREP